MARRMISTGRFLLVVLLCWISVIFLVISKLDDRINTQHSQDALSFHEDIQPIDKNSGDTFNPKLYMKHYAKRSEAVLEMVHVIERAVNKSNNILKRANETLSALLDTNKDLLEVDGVIDKDLLDTFNKLHLLPVENSKPPFKIHGDINENQRHENEIPSNDVDQISIQANEIAGRKLRPKVPDAADLVDTIIEKSKDGNDEQETDDEEENAKDNAKAQKDIAEQKVTTGDPISSQQEVKIADNKGEDDVENSLKDNGEVGIKKKDGSIESDEYVDGDETAYREGVDPVPVLPEAIYDRLAPNSPGEMGGTVPFNLQTLTEKELEEYEEGQKNHQFNEFLSKKISVRRTLRDIRPAQCPREFSDLPATSIIICFHNEAWTVLLRTIHSILDRSPEHLVKEIILVDDLSNMEHLRAPLEFYMKDYKKVRILRTRRREGLIRARLIGVAAATGPVLTFLDSHIECYHGWLEPLLDRVKTEKNIIVSPSLNGISANRFSVDGSPTTSVGKVDIKNLQFNWMPIQASERKRRKSDADPIRTPTIAGGLFSISKEYFYHLGKYDEGMEIWGFENVEISFRVWLCGGVLEIHPCSHVAHVFRSKSPYNWVKKVSDILRRNSVRVAEVWLDDYKDLFYQSIGYQLGNYGDVSERKQLRERLHCKPFQWFIDNVYPEIEIPPRAIFVGEIKSKTQLNICIDTMNLQHPEMQVCHGMKGNQLWDQFENGHLGAGVDKCLTFHNSELRFTSCTSHSENLKWNRLRDGHIKHDVTELCLQRKLGKPSITLEQCSARPDQLWEFVSAR